MNNNEFQSNTAQCSPNQVASSGVIVIVSSGFNALFKPVKAGIKIVEKAIDKPKSTINRFFTELAHTFGNEINC